MRWSFTIGTFKGTAVRIHVTLLLFLAWIGFAAYQRGGAEAAGQSVLLISAIFACVVLHEFGHILTARQFGIVSPEVTLLPIGGVADMNKMPEKPYQELLIAVAGPMVNVAIAIVLLALSGAFNFGDAAQISDPSISMVERLAATNIFLAIFNLIPAFPMDGGRVLRAGLAMWLGQDKATRIAAQIGQGFAFLLGFLGLTSGHPMLVFIAIFVYMAAAGEAQMTSMSEAARGLSAIDAMETRIATIDRGSTVNEAVEILLATSQDDFPVVDSAGWFHGLLSRSDIVEALRTSDPGAPIAPFARKETPTINSDATVDAALPALNGGETVGVIDPDGRLVGLLTRQSLAEIMMIRDARPDWRFSRRSQSSRTVA
ncbi:site-2 protease family protein [Methylocystis sp. WRRC1]|uniref:site-2 protease family protein n=1 Tax=Methylocystis sp. WRRC1 TaxID=1732014 RepID=UPI001D1393E8|nr:site-2 protease family protein [Methylocystis sp. WRRC1]MCC3244175.1 site-2 protease family protein [Methylocystis sp. WRRC1]